MGLVERLLRTVIVVGGTVLTVEWIHHRVGDETIYRFISGPSTTVLQSDGGSSDGSVTESELERYLEVLQAMQANHDLSIDDAVSARNADIDGFRDVEQRVQRNPQLVERVRDKLRENAESLWRQRGEPLETASSGLPSATRR